jgi:hypothetical protein
MANIAFESDRCRKINEYLDIPHELLNEYAELFVDQNKLSDHFNWRHYAHNYMADGDSFFNKGKHKIVVSPQDAIDCQISKLDDFNVQKVQSIDYKLKFLFKFREPRRLDWSTPRKSSNTLKSNMLWRTHSRQSFKKNIVLFTKREPITLTLNK